MSFPRRAYPALAVLIAALAFPLHSVRAALPDYKLGDVATEDVFTPVAFFVPNPEATDALRQKVSQQVPFIVRQTANAADEAQAELRATVVAARAVFLEALQRGLGGRAPVESDVGSSAFATAIRDVAREAAKDLPLSRLAPLWVRGQSDEVLVESLLQPVRDAMSQPIVTARNDAVLTASQLVRLIPVKSAAEIPSLAELTQPRPSVSSAKVISLWRARRIVETHFPSAQDELGKFAASFVRTNAYPDTSLTEILRAREMDGVTVNDSYEAAQVVIRKGQSIDRKALSALAIVREKSLIGTLQAKLEQEKTVSGQIGEITAQTKWIVAGFSGIGVALLLVLWRLRARPASLLPVLAAPGGAGNFDPYTLPGGEGDDAWRHRAIAAEGKAERAHQAIRSGVLVWMREKIFQTLFRQRAELLSVQQKAQAEMTELEQRMESLHTPLQERIGAYEKRIGELERELAVKGEENRELLGARINVARQRLSRERERGRFGGN